MKRIISALLAVILLFPVCVGATSLAAPAEVIAEEVRTYIDVEVGTELDVLFLLEAADISGKSVELRDENGKTVSSMRDSGTKGDKIKNDNVYSAPLTLSSNERGTVTYTAYVDGVEYREYEVNYYKEFTSEDEADIQSVYDRINNIEASMEAENATDDEIFNAVLEYLQNCKYIERVEADNGSIAYTSTAGIASLYARFKDGIKGAGEPQNEPVAITANGRQVDMEALSEIKGNEELQSWTNPNVLLVRPFRNVSGQEGFHNDRYIDAAAKITSYTGGYVTVLDNEETIPFNLLETFWQNGFVMVDSHGLTGYGNSYMCVWDGGGYNSGDVSANRVMRTNDPTHVYISGEYFQYYYERENRTMENTFLYFGICYGMTYDTLRTPFFEMGAVCAYGYDNSVSMGYEGYNLLVMYPYLATVCKEDPTRTYNLEEAVAEAIRRNGDEDPYGDNGAHLEMHGDTKFVLYKPDVEVTGMSMLQESLEGTVDKNCYIPIKLTPEKTVYGYEQEWTSSDPDILEIVGTRMGKCKAVGEVTVSVKITYNGKTYEDDCKVVVSEKLPETITAECSAASLPFKVGQTREISVEVLPLDCGDKRVGYISNNPGVATIDEDGVVCSHRPGKFVITAYTIADPNVQCQLELEVINALVYKTVDEIKYNSDYLIVSKSTSTAALTAQVNSNDNHYLQGRSLSKYMDFYGGNINDLCLWQFIETGDGFYVYNAAEDAYLSRGENGDAYLSEEPLTVLTYTNTMLAVQNPGNDTELIYLRYRSNKGFEFSKEKTNVAKFDLARKLDFANNDEFATVTFNYNGETIATQRVEKGEKAVAAVPNKEFNITFLGWDKSMANITENMTANAILEEGESDKIIITFKDFDGTDIERIELDEGEECTPPEPPVHEGLVFVGWSEDINNITANMTVFAVYTDISNQLIGDANSDGIINTADAVIILRSSAGLETLTESQLISADTTKDGQVNTGDAVLILRYAAGLITEF